MLKSGEQPESVVCVQEKETATKPKHTSKNVKLLSSFHNHVHVHILIPSMTKAYHSTYNKEPNNSKYNVICSCAAGSHRILRCKLAGITSTNNGQQQSMIVNNNCSSQTTKQTTKHLILHHTKATIINLMPTNDNEPASLLSRLDE